MQPQDSKPHLSSNAIADLKEIIIAECDKDVPEDEIQEMGVRLLKLFSILLLPTLVDNGSGQKITEDQFKALKYIHQCLYHEKRQPTARGVSEALGLRSSRSGFRMLNILISQKFIHRDQVGMIVMRDDLAGCETAMII